MMSLVFLLVLVRRNGCRQMYIQSLNQHYQPYIILVPFAVMGEQLDF